MIQQRHVLVWSASAALLAFGLYELSGVLLPFAAGITLGYLLDPLADRLERFGLHRLGATFLILLLFLVALVLLALVLVPVLAHQFMAFIDNLPAIAGKLQELIALGSRYLQAHGGETLKKLGLSDSLTSTDIQNSIGSLISQASAYLLGLLRSLWFGGQALYGLFSLLVVTPVVAFYILLDWKRMIATIDGWVPLEHRTEVRAIARDIDKALAGFVRGQFIVSVFLGLWYGVGLTLIGLNFGFLIGMTGGFLSFVPYVGSLAVMIVSLAVALVQSWPAWDLMAMTFGVVFVGQFLEGNVLSPNLVGANVGLHPVWIIFALLAFSSLFGFTGLLVAVPVAAAGGVVARFLLRKYLRSDLYTGEQETKAPYPVAHPVKHIA